MQVIEIERDVALARASGRREQDGGEHGEGSPAARVRGVEGRRWRCEDAARSGRRHDGLTDLLSVGRRWLERKGMFLYLY